jgi:hypothetical protein
MLGNIREGTFLSFVLPLFREKKKKEKYGTKIIRRPDQRRTTTTTNDTDQAGQGKYKLSNLPESG